MNKVKSYPTTEAYSSILNVFLYRRLKKTKLYKSLLLSSVLHSLFYTYYKLTRAKDFFTKKTNFKLFGNRGFLSKRIYLTRLGKLSEIQHSIASNTVTNHFRTQYLLNPFIPIEKWDSFLFFLTNPEFLENKLFKINLERFTVSALDSILSSSQKKVYRPLKNNWSYEMLYSFFNFKFNFVVNRSNKKNTTNLSQLGLNYNYNAVLKMMYRKLDLFLETFELVPQRFQHVETYINGYQIKPSTVFLTVGDILSYKTLSRHSDMSVTSNHFFVSRKWLICLHVLFSLNRIYTSTVWIKLKSFFFKITNVKTGQGNYFFYKHVCHKLIHRNPIFKNSAFLLETTAHYVPTMVARVDTINSILFFSDSILRTRFFTVRLHPIHPSGICNTSSFLDLHFLMTLLIKKVVTLINASRFNDFEIFNILGFFNRWVLLDNRATICVARSFMKTFYLNYKFPINGSTLQSVEPFFFSPRSFSTTGVSIDISFFIEIFVQPEYFLGLVDNIISLQWSFFSNLKQNSLIAFNYIRWHRLNVEYVLFYYLNDISTGKHFWFHQNDKIGLDWQYTSFLRYR